MSARTTNRLAARRAGSMGAMGNSAQPISGVSRVGGRYHGTLSNWTPYETSRQQIPYERRLVALRAEDLVANDPHAASLVGGMAINVVGGGIKPQAQINASHLGITEEQAQEIQDQAERAFDIWSAEADAGGRMSFEEIQYLDIHAALTLGEYIHLCRMIKDDPDRTFSFALRSVSPHRLSTPSDLLMDPTIVEGVQLGGEGQPMGYWLQNPCPFTGQLLRGAASGMYVYNPAKRGHRPVVLHAFPVSGPEQVRGVSVLAPAMKFFRDLADCLDYNLVGQIVSASFPMVVKTDNPQAAAGYQGPPGSAPERRFYRELPPGSVTYLNENESLDAVTNPNPPNTFQAFVERILRAAGAAAGMPYELVAKDFSKTNYSSARAALLEAWKVLSRYSTWLTRVLCQPCWEAVFEEAWLKGMITLPKGAPDFYDAQYDYTRCLWIPPKRGSIDPLKEMAANIEGLKAGLLTYAEIIEGNGGDCEGSFKQQARERGIRKTLDLPMPEESGKVMTSENAANSDAANDQEVAPGKSSPSEQSEQGGKKEEKAA